MNSLTAAAQSAQLGGMHGRRLQALAVAALFSASLFGISFHLAFEEHDVPADHEHRDDRDHDPTHPPHSSKDHAIQAFTAAPRTLSVAFMIVLPAVAAELPAPQLERLPLPEDGRAPPEAPFVAPASPRAPPL